MLREITLEEPIRYAQGDPIEKWLNDLLCLDCAASIPRIITGQSVIRIKSSLVR